MSERQSYFAYREDSGHLTGDGARLSLAVIEYALTTHDRRFFESEDFIWWLSMAGIMIDDYRVKAMLEQVRMMPKQEHKRLTIGQRLSRVRNGY
jgi:hypothetical protein